MKGSNSLEDERQAILARMRASREEYRLLLGGGTHEQHETSAARNPLLEEQVYEAQHGAPVMHHTYAYGDDLHSDGHGGTVSSYRATHQPHSQRPDVRQLALAALGTTTTVVKRHPLAVAAVVAALVAIGPRRVMRGAAKGGTVVAALTLRNPRNIDMLTRLITTVADIVQRGRARHPP